MNSKYVTLIVIQKLHVIVSDTILHQVMITLKLNSYHN